MTEILQKYKFNVAQQQIESFVAFLQKTYAS